MLPSWSSKTPDHPDCRWQIVIGALLMTGPCHAAADGARSGNYFRLQRGQYFILSPAPGHHSVCISASSPTSGPDTNIHHDQWWGEPQPDQTHPRPIYRAGPSSGVTNDVGLSRYPLGPCVTWPGADSWYQTQPGLHLHRAPHTKSAQNIALQSPCIKLADVWLLATHGARLFCWGNLRSVKYWVLRTENSSRFANC